MLAGKRAAVSPALRKNFAGIGHDPTVTWEDNGVVADGNVITAGSSDDAKEFAAAILKAIKAD